MHRRNSKYLAELHWLVQLVDIVHLVDIAVSVLLAVYLEICRYRANCSGNLARENLHYTQLRYLRIKVTIDHLVAGN